MNNNLVLVTKDEFDVDLEIRYATSNNIVGKQLYKNPNCYLHKDAAFFLERSIKLAKKKNLRIKIFDGFRPLLIQEFLFENCQDFPGLVSDPKNGSIPHCRGVAIDLTLVDQFSGKELDMGTDFDDVTDLAYHNSSKISPLATKNRLILKSIMIDSGWDFYQKEWWHYQVSNPRHYPVINNLDL